MKLNPAWKAEREAEIQTYLRDGFQKIDVTSSCNMAIQWLICQLVAHNIPFKVIQLGAGVKRVTTDTTVCPKCNGTGKC
jgi:hypothetical protein